MSFSHVSDQSERARISQSEAESESKFLQGQGIAKQRAAIVEGLRSSFGVGEKGEMDAEKVRELLLITQYFDTLEKMSASHANTIFMPHSVGGIADIADQIRNGVMAGNSANRRG